MADALAERHQLWTAEVADSSGGAVVLVSTWADLINVTEPVLPVGEARVPSQDKGDAYFARLDAAFEHLSPEPRDDRGGLPGEIFPI